jgi:hypothetical protein
MCESNSERDQTAHRSPPIWLPPSLQLITTADGSPTLRDSSEHANHSGEHMHHSGGAATESQYVYLPALRWIEDSLLNERGNPVWGKCNLLEANTAVFVVGLGLGYLEMLTVAWWINSPVANRSPMQGVQMASNLHLVSFEKNETLAEAFLGWVQGNPSEVHEQIANRIAQDENTTPQRIRSVLAALHSTAQWHILGDFVEESTKPEADSLLRGKDAAAILFDAYSPESSPAIWSKSTLDPFLSHFQNIRCCAFATYASRTALKAILRDHGFTLMKRPGFGRKRESTLALRLR